MLGLKAMTGGMTTVEGGRGPIKKRMEQIKKRTAAAGNKSVNDGSGRQQSGHWTMEQGRKQQPTINGSGKGKQWLEKMRVRGQQLAMVVKGGSGRRRDYHGQGGVIAASEAAEASWIWTTRCMQLRAATSRRMGLSFGDSGSYCGDGIITRRWTYR